LTVTGLRKQLPVACLAVAAQYTLIYVCCDLLPRERDRWNPPAKFTAECRQWFIRFAANIIVESVFAGFLHRKLLRKTYDTAGNANLKRSFLDVRRRRRYLRHKHDNLIRHSDATVAEKYFANQEQTNYEFQKFILFGSARKVALLWSHHLRKKETYILILSSWLTISQ